MKVTKVAGLIVVGLLSAGIALADGVDPRASAGRGPTGSPNFTPSLSLPVANSGSVIDDYTVNDGVVTSISITLPAADTALGVTCGASNAFEDGGAFNIKTGGFAPVINSDGSATCNYTAFAGTYDDQYGFKESVLEMEIGCTLSNLGVINDFEDCAGVPSDTTDSDVVFNIYGAIPGTPLAANSVVTPEPASLALLVMGLVSLPLLTLGRRLVVMKPQS
jgi:hypothetical protein